MVHRCRGTTFLVVLAVLIGGFFEAGCSLREVAADAAEGGLDRAKEWVKAEVAQLAPKLEAKATEFIEKKLAEQETKGFAILDEQLARVSLPDLVTGARKTWRDFDLDKNGHLEVIETGRLSAYVLTEGAKRVADGTMTKDEFSQTTKDTAKGAAIPTAVATGLWLLNRRKKAKDAPPAPAPAAGPGPKPEQPAGAPAAAPAS